MGDKTEKQLIEETESLRKEVAGLRQEKAKRKRAEEALRAEKDKLQALMDGLARTEIGIDVVGIGYEILFQNQTLKERFGDLTGELCYEKYMGLKNPCDFCPMIRAIKTNKVESVELTGVDGRNYELTSAPLPNPDGTVDKAIEVVLDITERKKAEESLRGSEECYRALFENSIEGVFTMDLAGNFTSANKALAELNGCTVKELIGASYREFTAPEYVEFVFKKYNGLFRTGKPIHNLAYEIIRKDGERRLVEGYVNVIKKENRVVGFQGTLRDITERKKAEESLRGSEECYRALFENSIEGVFTVDLAGRHISCNKALEELLGYTNEERVGASYKEVVAPEYAEFVFKKYNKMFRTGKPIHNLTYEIIRKDGERRLVEGYVNVIKKENRVVGFQGTLRDITERKRAEDALQESERRYRLVADNATDVIWITDMNLGFTYMSPSSMRMLGYSADEVMAKTVKEMLTPGSLDVAMKAFAEELAIESTEEKDPLRSRTLEFELNCKDGSAVWAEAKMTFIRDPDGRPVGILGITRDITKRKKAEEQIKASLKEKEVMLREINHRVKNNLQVISSLLRLQSGQIKDERDAEMFKESQNRVNSMALIHEKLYQSEDLARIEFGEYIKSLVRSLRASYGSDAARIALRTEVEGVMLGVNQAIPCGLIINELVSNSLKHAFPGGEKGQIGIAMRPIGEDEVELVVSDNGIGIPEDLDFRNTESLGLRLVTMLAEDQLGGEIKLDRTEGTRFQIKFRVAK